MINVSADQIIHYLSPFVKALPPDAVIAGRVIANGLPMHGYEFYFEGKGTDPVADIADIRRSKLFNIGSTSKTFTATMLAQLDNQNPSQWGQVTDHLGFLLLPSNIPSISLIDLARYASGFYPDNIDPWLLLNGSTDIKSINTLSQLSSLLNNNLGAWQSLPQQTPGIAYSYSNLGWGLLGLCLCGLSSEADVVASSFNNYLQSMFNQIGLPMPNTLPYQCLSPDQQSKMVGFEGQQKLTGNFEPNTVMYVGSGGLTTTLADMSNWLLFNMGFPIAQDNTACMLTQAKQFDGYGITQSPICTGLGWFRTPLKGNEPAEKDIRIYKNGGVKGFTSFMSFKNWLWHPKSPPPSDTGVLILANFRSYVTDDKKILDASVIGSALMNYLSEDTQACSTSTDEINFDN